MGYTKLFEEIVDSTIWQAPDHIRILWITMLAKKQRNHTVQAAIPGLARAAGITVEQCEEGLEHLMAPDPYSRTKDHEGRRIKECDGGWFVLNGEKYREKMNEDERREYKRIWIANKRAKDKEEHVDTVDESRQQMTSVTHTDTDTDTKADTSNKTLALFNEFWSVYPKKKSKAAAEKAWRKLDDATKQTILKHMESRVTDEEWLKEGGKFIPYPATFLNAQGWEDEWQKSTAVHSDKTRRTIATMQGFINE